MSRREVQRNVILMSLVVDRRAGDQVRGDLSKAIAKME
jgi:hypothetical protein